MVGGLKQKLNLIDRMVIQQESMRQKQEDAQNQIDKLRPLLKLVVQRTRELQTEVCYAVHFCKRLRLSVLKHFLYRIQLQIEQDISKRYKNRTVHLTGGVNTL